MDLVKWLTVNRAGVVIAGAAFVLSVITWLTTRHGVRQAKRQAAAAEVQAEAATTQATLAERAVVVAQEQAEAARAQVKLAERTVAVAREQAEAAREQVALAVRQLEQAERMRLEQMRPFVIVDLRPDTYQPQLLALVLHNQGSTIARNIRVTFDPPLKPDARSESLDEWRVSTLAPGAQMTRPITSGRIFFNGAIERTRQGVIVEAEDAQGPLEMLAYDIDLAALGTVAAYGKTIYHVVEALEKIAENTLPENVRNDQAVPGSEDEHLP